MHRFLSNCFVSALVSSRMNISSVVVPTSIAVLSVLDEASMDWRTAMFDVYALFIGIAGTITNMTVMLGIIKQKLFGEVLYGLLLFQMINGTFMSLWIVTLHCLHHASSSEHSYRSCCWLFVYSSSFTARTFTVAQCETLGMTYASSTTSCYPALW